MKYAKTWLRNAAGLACLATLAAAPAGAAGAPVVPVIIGSIAVTAANPADTESVLRFLQRYESTLASGRVERIVDLYEDFDTSRRAELQSYFDNVIADLVVRLDDIHVDVDGDLATVKFDRTDMFKDRSSGKGIEKGVALDAPPGAPGAALEDGSRRRVRLRRW